MVAEGNWFYSGRRKRWRADTQKVVLLDACICRERYPRGSLGGRMGPLDVLMQRILDLSIWHWHWHM